MSQKPYIKPPPRCEDYTTQSECEAVAGCYWYNNSCHSTPQGEFCQSLRPGACYSNVLGRRQCDRYNNLCECTSPGIWNLVEENSLICRDKIEYGKCYLNEEDMAWCASFAGKGTDECEIGGFGEGCSCISPGYCQSQCICEPRDKKCVIMNQWTPGGGTILGTSTNGTMYCFDSGGNSYCNYYFKDIYGNHRPVAGTTLSGSLYWKWGPFPIPGEPVDWGIWAAYNGEFISIKEKTDWVFSETGRLDIPSTTFSPPGVDYLQFGMGALVSNIHVDKFIGSLMY